MGGDCRFEVIVCAVFRIAVGGKPALEIHRISDFRAEVDAVKAVEGKSPFVSEKFQCLEPELFAGELFAGMTCQIFRGEFFHLKCDGVDLGCCGETVGKRIGVHEFRVVCCDFPVAFVDVGSGKAFNALGIPADQRPGAPVGGFFRSISRHLSLPSAGPVEVGNQTFDKAVRRGPQIFRQRTEPLVIKRIRCASRQRDHKGNHHRDAHEDQSDVNRNHNKSVFEGTPSDF